MMELVETEDILETVLEVTKGDHDLCARFHYASPSDHKTSECAEFTTKYILEETPPDAKFYRIERVMNNRKRILVGYVCMDHDCVWDFGVKLGFRNTPGCLERVWRAISKNAYLGYTVRLYDSNYRDINWLLKNGWAKPIAYEESPKGIWHWHGPKDGGHNSSLKGAHTFYTPLSQILLNFIVRFGDSKKLKVIQYTLTW